MTILLFSISLIITMTISDGVGMSSTPPSRSLSMYDQRFRELYPQRWDTWDEETRQTLIRIYQQSKNKYYWFPEYHEKPFNHVTRKF